MDGIVLGAQAAAGLPVLGNGNGGGMAEGGELVREIMHVDSAVGAEVVVKGKENVAHAERRL